jgi:hypothetical protein
MITQPLVERDTVSDPERTRAFILRNEKQQTSRLVLWGFIIMFIGAAIGVMGKKLVHDEIVTVVGVLISLAGMFLTVYPYLSPPKKHDSNPSSQPEALAQSQPTKYLPQGSDIEYVPSISERTTDLLATSEVRPRRKED